MPPPPSYIDITPIPFSVLVTQAQFNGGTFGGVANQCWFRFVTATDVGLGSFTDHGGTFFPTISLYQSDGTTLIATFTSGVTGSRSWFYAVTAGTYYLKIVRSLGGASNFDFTSQFDTVPADTYLPVPGDLIVNDDSGQLPATIVNSSGVVIAIATEIPTGEMGAMLPNRVSIWHDRQLRYGNPLAIIDGMLAFRATVPTTPAIDTFQFPCLTHNDTDFYAVDGTDGPVFRISEFGSATQIATIAGIDGHSFAGLLAAVCVSADAAVMFWAHRYQDGAIHRWDLVNDTALSDFYTIPSYDTVNDGLATTGNGHPGDLIRMADDSLVTWFFDASLNQDVILHISAAGALLNSYPQGAAFMDHLAPIEGSSTRIMVWEYVDFNVDVGRFGELDLLTGLLSSFETVHFEQSLNMIEDDATLFAPSQSCTFFLFPGAGADTPPVLGPIAWMEWKRAVP